MEINKFTGIYGFMDNKYPATVTYLGTTYQNAEAAFQAMKLYMPRQREQFTNLSGEEAIQLGNKITVRDDWKNVKEKHMLGIIKAKFEQNPELMEKLQLTKDNDIIYETNNDSYWGVCGGTGNNKLGNILMQVREDEARHGDFAF